MTGVQTCALPIWIWCYKCDYKTYKTGYSQAQVKYLIDETGVDKVEFKVTLVYDDNGTKKEAVVYEPVCFVEEVQVPVKGN